MATIRVGPARVPSRKMPQAAVEILLERGYAACEIDFEGLWMDYPTTCSSRKHRSTSISPTSRQRIARSRG
jgi:hypothetical protein